MISAYVQPDSLGSGVNVTIVMENPDGGSGPHVLRPLSTANGRVVEQSWEPVPDGADVPATLRLSLDAVTALADALERYQTPSKVSEAVPDEPIFRTLYEQERKRVNRLLKYVMENL